MKIRKHFAVLLAAASLTAFAYPALAGVASATTFPTRHVAASGGKVTWTVRVSGYGWCTWWSSPRVPKFNKTQRCDGRTERSAKLMPNLGATSRRYTFRLTFLGKKTKSTNWMKVTEASQPTAPPTTRSSYCIAPKMNCWADFPAVDDFGATSLLVGYVLTNVVCPDPGVCDQPAG